MIYDLVGVTSFDRAAGGTGVQPPSVRTSLQTLNLGFTLTPSVPSSVVIVAAPWDNNTAAGIAGMLLDTNTVSGENCDGPLPVDENNGWAHVVTHSSGPVGFTWTGLCGLENFSNWSAVAISLK
jgi:hypothetical protein